MDIEAALRGYPEPMVDKDCLLELRSLIGDARFVGLLAEIFDTLAQSIAVLHDARAAAASDADLRAIAHSLKGMAGSVGLARLSAVATAAEEALVIGDRTHPCVTALRSVITETERDLWAYTLQSELVVSVAPTALPGETGR